ncbi:MAG: hypothetical protein NC217_07030 [Muribaculaceae bacterium]|nr:hypothetical protein [Muribaculaceae bacterium]
MVFAIVIVLLIWLLWLLSPYIRRWAARRTANYVQDQIYRSMGIDPKQMRQEARGAETKTRSRQGRTRTRRPYTGSRGRIIPRDYGEVVPFEVLKVTGTEKWLQDTDKSPVVHTYQNEVQITDAMYTVV